MNEQKKLLTLEELEVKKNEIQDQIYALEEVQKALDKQERAKDYEKYDKQALRREKFDTNYLKSYPKCMEEYGLSEYSLKTIQIDYLDVINQILYIEHLKQKLKNLSNKKIPFDLLNIREYPHSPEDVKRTELILKNEYYKLKLKLGEKKK